MSGENKQPKTFICIDCGKYAKPLRKLRCKQCYRKWKVREAPKIKCICDPRCQVMISSIRYDGKPNYYAKMHNTRGENHYNWKGGIEYDGHGYITRYAPYHPFADHHGRVREHRLYYECYYSCCLLPYVEIHHRDGDKTNNFDINNLQPVYDYQHTSIHHPKTDKSDRRCSDPKCSNPYTTSIGNDGYEKWYRDGIGGYICHNCYSNKNSYKRRKDYKNRINNG